MAKEDLFAEARRLRDAGSCAWISGLGVTLGFCFYARQVEALWKGLGVTEDGAVVGLVALTCFAPLACGLFAWLVLRALWRMSGSLARVEERVGSDAPPEAP